MSNESQEQGNLLTAFGGLGEIDDAKNVQARPTSALEYLMGVETQFIKKTIKLDISDINFDDNSIADKIYIKLYTKLKETELKEVEFTEKDLESFILAKTDSDYGVRESLFLGMYSGALLHILTERNKAKGQRTQVYVNGNGRKFNFLFSFAQVVDELVFENFVGNYLGMKIGHNSGSAYRVIGRNLKGTHIFLSVGYNKGNINQLIGIDIKGNYPLFSLGDSRGGIDQIVGVNICGHKPFSNLSVTQGRINQVIGIEVKRNYDSNLVISGVCKYGGRIYQLLCPDARKPIEDPTENYIFVSFASQRSSCTELILHEEGISEYKTKHPDNKIDETLALTRSLKDAPYPKVLEIADKLYALRPKVPDNFFEREERK